MKRFDLFGIGAALLDVECHVDGAMLAELGVVKGQEGQMTLLDHATQQKRIDWLSDQSAVYGEACGGSVANSIITARHFGAVTYLACRVSDDEPGRVFLRSLEQVGVSHQVEGRASGVLPTGRCLVLLTADAERTMQTTLGANQELSVDDVDAEALAESKHVYIEGYLAGSECGLEAAMYTRQMAVRSGVPIAIGLSDVNIVQGCRDGLSQLIGADGVDVLFCNRAEALAWTGADTLDQALPELGAMARCVAITTGADGVVLWHENTATHIAAYPVAVVDTNGAGDAFAGVFLYSLLRGYSLPHAGGFANYVAADLVSRYGPRLPPAVCTELNRNFTRPVES